MCLELHLDNATQLRLQLLRELLREPCLERLKAPTQLRQMWSPILKKSQTQCLSDLCHTSQACMIQKKEL